MVTIEDCINHPEHLLCSPEEVFGLLEQSYPLDKVMVPLVECPLPALEALEYAAILAEIGRFEESREVFTATIMACWGCGGRTQGEWSMSTNVASNRSQ